MAQPTGPIVGATNKPSGSVKLGVGAEIRPVARHGVAQFRRRRYCQGTGRGATCKSYGVSNEKKKRKMSVLLAFCHTFIYCIYPRQKPINCWRFGVPGAGVVEHAPGEPKRGPVGGLVGGLVGRPAGRVVHIL